MIVHQDEPGEWEEYTYPRSGYDRGDKIHPRWAGELSEPGCVVSGRAVESHKIPKTIGSYSRVPF